MRRFRDPRERRREPQPDDHRACRARHEPRPAAAAERPRARGLAGRRSMTPSSTARATADTTRWTDCSPLPARCSGWSSPTSPRSDESELVLREVNGDVAAYGGVAPASRLPRELSWCHAMMAGEAPQLVPDAAGTPGRRAPVRRRHRHPRLRGRSRAPPGRLALRHALLPEPRAAARAGGNDLRYLDVLARMAADRLAAAEGAQQRPARRGRGRRGTGAARGAQRARELHGRALRGRAGAGARGRERDGHGRAGGARPSGRSRCCTTSARSASRTRSCASRAG